MVIIIIQNYINKNRQIICNYITKFIIYNDINKYLLIIYNYII